MLIFLPPKHLRGLLLIDKRYAFVQEGCTPCRIADGVYRETPDDNSVVNMLPYASTATLLK